VQSPSLANKNTCQPNAANAIKYLLKESIALAALPFGCSAGLRSLSWFLAAVSRCTPLRMYLLQSFANSQKQSHKKHCSIYRSSTL
jgi:hypothetical protein